MKILALDLGTACGYALSNGDRDPISGTLDLRPRRHEGGGMRYLTFRTNLRVLSHEIDLVVYEEVRRHLGTDAAHVYGGLLAVLQAECEERKIPYQGVPVGTIKRFATGKGNADKGTMVAAAQVRWPNVKDDNEADALWLLAWAIQEFAPATAG